MKKFKHFALMLAIFVLAVSLLLCGCSSNVTDVPDAKDDVADTAEPDVSVDKTDEETKKEENDQPAKDNNDEKADEPIPETAPNDEKIDVVEEVDYTVSFDESQFSVENSEYCKIITLNGTSDTYVEFRFIEGEYPDTLAPSFMEGYFDYKSIEFAGVNNVGNSDESGELILASNGNQNITAFLIETANGTLAVIMSHNTSASSAVISSLNDIIDSLVIDHN